MATICGFGLSNTGSVAVVLSAGSTPLAQPAATQTLVKGHVEQASNGATIYTVNVGKTFYCTGVSIGLVTGGHASISIDGTVSFDTPLLAGTSCCHSGGILFSLGATKVITVNTNAGASTASCTVWGFEV